MKKHSVEGLVEWYLQHQRDLPWRKTRDPYKIWISETMLQQTTSRAVIPYYEKFLKLFPTVETLGGAPVEDVLAAWSGLGYYSRARNLHKAAQSLAQLSSFPQDVESLLELPGFGPYTARAVASLAFEVPAGVVDGNTIRVMARFCGWRGEWWRPKEREKVQEFVDAAVAHGAPSVVNQALMELGATVCTPLSPTCLLCPIKKDCVSFKQARPQDYPLKKSKKQTEIWLWQPTVMIKGQKIALVKNETLPFLKNQWLLPGAAKKLKAKPQHFDYQHAITHYKIYVVTQKQTPTSLPKNWMWVPQKELKKWCPVSLVEKALRHTREK